MEHSEHTVFDHAVHAVERYFPDGQVPHTFVHCVVRPVVVENVPVAQAVHIVEPSVPDHVPAGHERQFDELVAPIKVEYVPAGHRVHCVAPAVEYVPAGHTVLSPRIA